MDANAPTASALIVDPDVQDMLAATRVLSEVGFRVSHTADFHEAKSIVQTAPPDVLLAEIRLGGFNGLQLAIYGRQAHPGMAALVTSRFADPALQAEADCLSAVFVPKPTTPRELIAAVFRTIFCVRGKGPFEALRPPFERRQVERRTSPAHLVAERVHDRRRTDRRADRETLLRLVSSR